jgi:hypothetical protein
MTLSALGIFSAAGAGGGVALSDYELIQTTVLGSSTPSVTFSSLGTYSSTYKHLQIRMTARVDQVNDQIFMRINADTGSNYARHELVGNGSSVGSNASTSQTAIQFGRVAYSSQTANAFTGFVMDILDPYATKNKTIRCLGGDSINPLALTSGLWNNTSSLTTILIYAGATNFVTGSRFSLYGIKG